MDIYLLRHGLSTSNEMRLVCGAADYSLSETGELQAEHVCAHLSEMSFTRIYSSPLQRALQTIHKLKRRVGGWYERCSREWLQDDIILIAGHEGTVCGILHKLLDLDITHYPTFQVGNCDYVHIVINADGQRRYRFVPLASLSQGSL